MASEARFNRIEKALDALAPEPPAPLGVWYEGEPCVTVAGAGMPWAAWQDLPEPKTLIKVHYDTETRN